MAYIRKELAAGATALHYSEKGGHKSSNSLSSSGRGDADASAAAVSKDTADVAEHDYNPFGNTSFPVVLLSHHDDDLTSNHNHSGKRTALHSDSMQSLGLARPVEELHGPVLHLHRCRSPSDMVYLANTQIHQLDSCYAVVFGAEATCAPSGIERDQHQDQGQRQNQSQGQDQGEMEGGRDLMTDGTKGEEGGSWLRMSVGEDLAAPVLLHNSIDISLQTRIRGGCLTHQTSIFQT